MATGGAKPMKVFYTAKSKLHNPLYEINNGEKVPHPENAQRIEVILEELSRQGYVLNDVDSVIPFSLLYQVHRKDFIQFIKKVSTLLKQDEHLYSDVFLRGRRRLKNTLALMGQYSFDVYTPIVKGTYAAAIAAASLAYKGAQEIANGKAKILYTLTHPIGHHSLPDKIGGYCYFNNAAIAAHYLSQFGRVAILDLDFHHGNGTQEIFYARDDVLFVSIHADPNLKFPYYWGYRDEKGEGKGLGFNVNYPLPLGTRNEIYQETLVKAVRDIRQFGPQFLIVSLGFDTYKDDPIGGFKLTTDYYQQAGKTINKLDLPTLIVQEGGYNLPALGKNVCSFLQGFQ
jgi:acetoin utilization deacetylase AcuC-like enzyme